MTMRGFINFYLSLGYINNLGVCAMISDVYKTFNKDFQPAKSDIDSYTNVFIF